MTEEVSPEDFRRQFGAHLQQLRLRAGLSQAALASLLPGAKSSSEVSRWERGEVYPGLENQLALAAALDVEMRELFQFEER